MAKEISRKYQEKGYSKQDADRLGYASVVEINKNPKVKKELDNELKRTSASNKIRNR